MIDLQKLKQHRENKGLTQSKLAHLVGISTSHYSHVEKGERGVSVETLEAIVQVLEITLEDIMRDDDTLPRSPAGIIVESSDGNTKTKYILPPTPETYQLIADQMAGDKRITDPKLLEVLRIWETTNEQGKDCIYKTALANKKE